MTDLLARANVKAATVLDETKLISRPLITCFHVFQVYFRKSTKHVSTFTFNSFDINFNLKKYGIRK